MSKAGKRLTKAAKEAAEIADRAWSAYKRNESLPPMACVGRCKTYGDCMRRPRCERNPDRK